MNRLLKRLSVLGMALTVMLGITLTATTGPAQAGTGLFYTVVDSDNDPYSGIYLRDGTSMSNVRRIASRYMLYGTQIELICGAWGEAVGPYANRRWHNVRVANGATTNQVGWVADRYTNTPNKANQYTPGEPECGAPPPPTNDGVVYFTSERNEISPAADVRRDYADWTHPDRCSSADGNIFPSVVNNKNITVASGWSLGRLGPIYMLERSQFTPSSGRWQEIDTILLFDPGSYADMFATDSCDRLHNGGYLYTEWLKANPNAKLIILATDGYTGQQSHRGIQEMYFNYLRANGGPRDRVLVCNYPYSHESMYFDFMYEVKRNYTLPLDGNDCPGTESWAWHP